MSKHVILEFSIVDYNPKEKYYVDREKDRIIILDHSSKKDKTWKESVNKLYIVLFAIMAIFSYVIFNTIENNINNHTIDKYCIMMFIAFSLTIIGSLFSLYLGVHRLFKSKRKYTINGKIVSNISASDYLLVKQYYPEKVYLLHDEFDKQEFLKE